MEIFDIRVLQCLISGQPLDRTELQQALEQIYRFIGGAGEETLIALLLRNVDVVEDVHGQRRLDIFDVLS